MSTGTDDIQALIELIAEVVPDPAAEIGSDSRLVEDIGLDSLGLSELVIGCVETFDAEHLIEGLETAPWSDVTVAMLYRKCTQNRGARPA